jgi:NADH-quinone oxidoreductase subunit B
MLMTSLGGRSMHGDLGLPTLGPPVPRPVAAPDPVRLVVRGGRHVDLWAFNLGLACCAVEFVAASMRGEDAPGLEAPAGTPAAQVMVVSGTVTDKLAPAVKRIYDAIPEPRYVVSFGSCSNCGGPYWDSYCVTKGVDQIVPVDVYVPGCPPRPEALVAGLEALGDTIAGSPG